MKIFNKKLFTVLLLISALLFSGCSDDKSSGNKEDTSPASITASITTSDLSSSHVNNNSSETIAKTKTLSSKNKDTKETISSVTKSSEKSVKTEIRKTKSTQKSKANKTRKNTTTQKANTKSINTTKNQDVKTTTLKHTSAKAKNEFLVTVEIECEAALDSKDLNSSVTLPSNGIILPKTEIRVKSGQSALDITKEICEKMNIPIVCLNGSYVKSIGLVGEKQFGKFSGWTYKVNGKKPPKSSDKYILEDKDTLVWSYVTAY